MLPGLSVAYCAQFGVSRRGKKGLTYFWDKHKGAYRSGEEEKSLRTSDPGSELRLSQGAKRKKNCKDSRRDERKQSKKSASNDGGVHTDMIASVPPKGAREETIKAKRYQSSINSLVSLLLYVQVDYQSPPSQARLGARVYPVAFPVHATTYRCRPQHALSPELEADDNSQKILSAAIIARPRLPNLGFAEARILTHPPTHPPTYPPTHPPAQSIVGCIMAVSFSGAVTHRQ